MKTTDLLKVVPVAAIALSVYSTGALAGATNRDENTAATPGPKATTTTSPDEGAKHRASQSRDANSRSSNSEASGSGSSGGTGSVDPTDSKWDRYNQGESSARPGAGATPDNADSGYDLSTGNTSGSSVGNKSSNQ